MADEEYEILPHQLLSDLKNEVEALKKKILQPDTKANELILEIESLKDSIHELTNIFKKALEETKEEDLTRVIKAVNEKMEAVISQNEIMSGRDQHRPEIIPAAHTLGIGRLIRELHIRFFQPPVIYEYFFIPYLNLFTREADSPFYEILLRIKRIAENDYLAPPGPAERFDKTLS